MLTAFLTLLGAATTAAAGPLVERQSGLSSFISKERIIALNGAIANIDGSGSELVPGAFPGIVVAAPSTFNPNYFYSWTRDSALTFTMLIDELILGNTSLQYLIDDYVRAQAILQTIANPSGTLYPAGLGLGEPKFYTNESRFNGDWGRPQRDGPALRAIALMNYCSYLVAKGQISMVKDTIWPIILTDLKYVGQYWNETGYDLWEEVHGSSFFTINSQHRALTQGMLLAKSVGETCSPCGQAPQILCFLSNNFWNSTGGYLTADVNVNNVNVVAPFRLKPEALETSTDCPFGISALRQCPRLNHLPAPTDIILGSIHVFDINATCNAVDFQPCNSKVLATHKVLVDSFRSIYPINNGTPEGSAIAIGRYPEDTYYNGNPWYLCTLAAAEILYDAVAQFNKSGQLTIDSTSHAFFKDIHPPANLGSHTGSNMQSILDSMMKYAYGFVSIIEKYLPSNGSISEQFNRTTGIPTSAYDLTWSFASFVIAARRRTEQYPPSWGFDSALPPASSCSASSYNSTGSYAPAIAAGAPTVDTSCTSEVLFTVNATTLFGQNIYLVGNTSLLGGATNDPDLLILPCNPGNYTSSRAEWFVDIWFPAGQPVEYQYVYQNANGSVIFENKTRTANVPHCGGKLLMLNDKFSTTVNTSAV